MAYTHSRLRKTLALVRIVMGLVFLYVGWFKVSSLEFARTDFPQFLFDAQVTAVGFYGKLLHSWVLPHAGQVAVAIGFMELFIGISLVLGFLSRPVSLLGMFYMLNLFLATWLQPAPGEPLWHYPQEQVQYILGFAIFLLLGIGHAGENWGLGTLYHGRRHERWEKRWDIKVVSGLPPTEPGSVETGIPQKPSPKPS